MGRSLGSLSALAVLLLVGSGCGLVRSTMRQFEKPPFPGHVGVQPPDRLSDAEIDRRVSFISQRLDDREFHAAAWEYGWLTVNAGGAAAASVQAGLGHGHDQVFHIINAVKGGIGTVYLLLDPLVEIDGADPVRELPAQTHAEKVAQLNRAETMLWDAAKRSEQRTGWFLHVGNILFNLAGGVVMLALHEPEKFALSFGLDSAVGEAQILTAPWEPVDDWKDYEHFVNTGSAAHAAEPRLRLLSGPGAVGLALEF